MTVESIVTDSDIERFEKDGVVCLRQALAPVEVEGLRASIDRAIAGIYVSPTGYDLSEIANAVWRTLTARIDAHGAVQYDLDGLAGYVRATGASLLADCPDQDSGRTGRFMLDTGVWTRDADFRKVALASALPEIAARLLRARKINYFDDQVFVKEPFTRERTAFHQDLGYFNLEGSQLCVMWAPVDRVNRAAGGMLYVRGSHRWGREFKPNLFVSQLGFPGAEGEALPDIEGRMGEYDIVSFDVEPGDVIVHHALTVHGSGGNHSPHPRRAASLRYCGEAVRFRQRPCTAPQPHHHHDLKDGDALDCAQFPVVWPRAYFRPGAVVGAAALSPAP